jgi:hypothetical protein
VFSLETKGFWFVVHWLVGVEIHNHCCKILHAYGQNEMTWDYQIFGDLNVCDRWKGYESYEFDENVWKKFEFGERFERDLNLVRGLNSFFVVLLQVVGALLQVIML